MVPNQFVEGVVVEVKPEIAIKHEAKEVDGDAKVNDPLAGLNNDSKACDQMDAPDGAVTTNECNLSKPSQSDDPDATEYSSSFGDTFSGSETDRLNLSDVEVESQMTIDNKDDRYARVFRKKRLTEHWRKFIRPLMWRCHWIELKMKELQSQALMYDKEIAKCMREKQISSETAELERIGCPSQTIRFMKRRKRRRKEDAVDIPAYMSIHSIFSYYDNKRSEVDGLSVDDRDDHQASINNKGTDDLGVNSEWPILGTRDTESSLEHILLTIENVQARVGKIKSQLNNVMTKNAKDISSMQHYVLPNDPLPSVPLSPSCSRGTNGEAMHLGPPNASSPLNMLSEFELGDPVMAGSTVSYGDAAKVDIVESTIGLLSTADGHPNQHALGAFSKDNADDVLISNQVAEERLKTFENVGHVVVKPQEVAKEVVDSSFEDDKPAPKFPVRKTGLRSEKVYLPPQQQPAAKPAYTGKRRGRKPKRKRRESHRGLASSSGSFRAIQRHRFS